MFGTRAEMSASARDPAEERVEAEMKERSFLRIMGGREVEDVWDNPAVLMVSRRAFPTPLSWARRAEEVCGRPDDTWENAIGPNEDTYESGELEIYSPCSPKTLTLAS